MAGYPCWLYHRDGSTRLVPDEETHATLGPDWADSPAVWAIPVSPDQERETPRDRDPITDVRRGRPRKSRL